VQTDARPGRFGYFAAALAGVAGIAGAVAIVAHLLLGLDGGRQFIAPGKLVLDVQQPGKQVVWYDYRTVFQGRTYDNAEQVPDGVRIRVTIAENGQAVEVEPNRGMSSKMSSADSTSVASFEVAAPGRYEIQVEGAFEPRVFSVGESQLAPIFGAVLGALGAVFLGLTAAVVLCVWTYMRRHPSEPVPAAPRPVGTPAKPAPAARKTPEEEAKELATIVYALQAASFVVGLTLIAGVIVNYLTRAQVAGTWIESHYRWQIRTFWWGLAWFFLGLATVIVLVGFLVWIASAIWLIYRLVKGWIRLSEGKAMYE
jgi:uncharacterized membrane protein